MSWQPVDPVPNTATLASGETHAFRPSSRVDGLPGERCKAGDVGEDRLREDASVSDEIPSRERLASVRPHFPPCLLFFEVSRSCGRLEVEDLVQVPLHEILKIVTNLAALLISRGAIPGGRYGRITGVPIDMAIRVSLNSWVSVPVPGSSRIAALLDADNVETEVVGELMGRIDP